MPKIGTSATAATPHVLYAAINDRKPLIDFLSEAIDNSFAEGAGDADRVTIIIGNESITVEDNGCGIDDLNKLVALGSSGSYSAISDIGQYGQGTKCWMGLAKKLEVRTIHNSLLHEHVFDMGPIWRALKKGLNDRWPNEYKGKGKATTQVSGTRIMLLNLVKGGPKIIVPSLVEELSRRYWAAIQAGKLITMIDARRGRTNIEVPPFIPPTLKKPITFESSVNSKKYKATFGILEAVGRNGGIFTAYGFRTIETITALHQRALPARLHGQVFLSDDWRKSFSRLKSRIVHDREQLLDDIESKIGPLLKEIEEELLFINDKEFSQIVQKLANKARRRPATADLPELPKEKEQRGIVVPITEHKPKPRPDPKPPTEKPLDYGYAIQWLPLGPKIMERVSVNDEQLVITLNSDLKAIAALREQPLWPATSLHLGSVIVAYTHNVGIEEISRYFGYMLGEEKNGTNRQRLEEQIRLWWAERSQELAFDVREEKRSMNLARARIAQKKIKESR